MSVKTRISAVWLGALWLTFCVPVSADDKPSSPRAAGLQVSQEVFGEMPDGTAVERYTLTNSHGLRVKLTPRGAAITVGRGSRPCGPIGQRDPWARRFSALTWPATTRWAR